MPAPIALPAFSDNYIWTLAGPDGRAVIVDPGETRPVIDAVHDHGLRPAAILLTHHHADHIGAAAVLSERFGLPVHGPDDRRIPVSHDIVGEGDTLTVAGLRFDVLAVPGHTLSHIAFVGEGVAFTGDTLFSLGCGRLFEGTPAQMLRSLKRLATLPGNTLLCCGHEYTLANGAFAQTVDPDNAALVHRMTAARRLREEHRPTLPTPMGNEVAANPFLRCTSPAISARVAARTGCDAGDELAVFTALRTLKDEFRAP